MQQKLRENKKLREQKTIQLYKKKRQLPLWTTKVKKKIKN